VCVCEDIAAELIKLIEGRNDLGHKVSYQKQWRRLKERVINVISALYDSCIETQEQAKQKLENWLNGIEESLDDIQVLGTWVKNPLSLRGREPTDFLPNFIHPKDLDLSFLSKINLSKAALDLALVQKNKVLEERNKELERELLEQKVLLLEYKAETNAKLEEARLREEKLLKTTTDIKSEMDKKLAEINELLKKILENQSKPNP
jgi:hypothetical protein